MRRGLRQLGRRRERGVRGLALALVAIISAVLVWQIAPDSRNINDSPFAGAMPPCGDGWQELEASYRESLSGTLNVDVLSVTLRRCVEHSPPRWLAWAAKPNSAAFRRWISIRTYEDDATAERFVSSQSEAAHRSRFWASWVDPANPPPFGDQAVRILGASTALGCIDDEGGACTVSESLIVRLGSTVVELVSEDRDAKVCAECMRYGGNQVAGDRRPIRNLVLLEGIVAQLVGPPLPSNRRRGSAPTSTTDAQSAVLLTRVNNPGVIRAQ